MFKMFSSFNGVEFKQTQSSLRPHIGTFGLGNYRGNAFTTGCSPDAPNFDDFGDDSCSRTSEIFDMTDMMWSSYLNVRVPDYPFTTENEYVLDNRKKGTQYSFSGEFIIIQQHIHLRQYLSLAVIIQEILSPNSETIIGNKLLL